jgi:hypothetical protein
MCELDAGGGRGVFEADGDGGLVGGLGKGGEQDKTKAGGLRGRRRL